MAETSMFWNGTTVGDATTSPYDAPDEFSQALRAIAYLSASPNLGGVMRGVANQLQPTIAGAVSPVSINTGDALCHGTYYNNSASVSIAIPNSVASRYDRIVVRKSWAAQTTRLTRIAGVEGGAAPALVQVAGTTWDIPICTVRIQVAALTLNRDDREFLPWQVPRLTNIQVGNEVEWGQTGFAPANYVVRDAVKMQMGVYYVDIAAADTSGSVVVTFPVVFNGDPIVLVTLIGGGGIALENPPSLVVSSIDDDEFTVWASRPPWLPGDTSVWFHWVAYGPELK